MARRTLWLQVGTVFFGVLMIASAVGLWRSIRNYEQLRTEEAEFQLYLSRFHSELAELHRSVILLSSTRNPALLTAGFSPQQEYQQLQERFSVARNTYQRLEPVLERWFQKLQGDTDSSWAIVRAQAEWRHLEAELESYLKLPPEVPQREIPNLSTLRALRDHPLDSIWQALRTLQAQEGQFFRANYQTYGREFWAFLGGVLVSLVGLLALGWYRWVYPTHRMRRWLRERARPLPSALHQSEWAPLLEAYQRQEARLREVEQFMRDLAMGRTPQPLAPEDPDDPLARTSQWLLKRFSEESQRKAV